MGIARRKLGLSPELYDPKQAVSTGERRADVLLEQAEEKKPDRPEKRKPESPSPSPTTMATGFDESKHPRGQPENKGEFVEKEQGQLHPRAAELAKDVIAGKLTKSAAKRQLGHERISAGVDPKFVAESLDTWASLARDQLKQYEGKRLGRDERQAIDGYKADVQMPKVHASLQKSGWSFEMRTKSGSLYYTRGGLDDRGRPKERLRVADHEVPETAERSYNSGQGGFSWATGGNQIILPVDDIDGEIANLGKEEQEDEET